jgi:hypothetical protein
MKLATGSAETPQRGAQASKGCANTLKSPVFAVQFTGGRRRYFVAAPAWWRVYPYL